MDWIFARAAGVLLSLALMRPTSSPAENVGISSRFINVTVSDVKMGERVRLADLGAPLYSIKNLGQAPVQVHIKIASPKRDQLKPGYKSIPDPSWVEIDPPYFSVSASDVQHCEIYVYVPGKPTFAAKKYQARIIATVDNSPFSVSAAISSNLMISTRPWPKKSRKK